MSSPAPKYRPEQFRPKQHYAVAEKRRRELQALMATTANLVAEAAAKKRPAVADALKGEGT